MSIRPLRLAIVALACSVLAMSAPVGLGQSGAAHAAPGGVQEDDSPRVLLAQRRARPRGKTKKPKGKATETTGAATDAAVEPPGDGKSGDSPSASGDGAASGERKAEPADAAASSGAPAPAGTAAASPAPPATSESTTPEVASSAELVDVDALRQEYLQLRDELFKSRARASTISSQLYSTKVTLRFAFASGRHYGVNKASIRLDGASVFDDTEGAVASDDAIRFEGYVAPGRHVLTFRIEVTGKDDDRFTSAHEAQVTLQAVAGKDLLVLAKAKDGGDIAYAWKRGEKGTYGLAMDISVKAQKRKAPAAGAKP